MRSVWGGGLVRPSTQSSTESCGEPQLAQEKLSWLYTLYSSQYQLSSVCHLDLFIIHNRTVFADDTENIAPSSGQCCLRENSMARTVSYLMRKIPLDHCNCVTSLEIPGPETHLTRGRGGWSPWGQTLGLVTGLTVVSCDLNAVMVITPLQLSSHWASQDWLPDGPTYFVHFLHCTLCVRLDWQETGMTSGYKN